MSRAGVWVVRKPSSGGGGVVSWNKAGTPTPVTTDDRLPVSVAALPLPSGAATADNQLPDNHQVQVSNLPTAYPLPADQLLALLPQTDALTNAELRAAPVVVDTGITQPTTPADTQPISATAL